ncbi:MAG: MFS transporter [Opitutaceae bacterium]|jgi:GPH family glycoside/pentoside/hexuronide:cation symporter|nr:MFS transporter [Opitutaceae bacterium]
MNASAATKADGALSASEKFAYGAGGLCDFFMANVLGALAVPVFTLGFGMDPFLLGVALALPQIVATLADPLVGAVSDRCRSRRGRRKPFLALGALAGAAVMPLVWWCPKDASGAALFAWVAGLGALLAVCRSLFAVPYGALGMELTPDYDERTRVFAWKNLVGTAGTFAAAWFYWFCQRPLWGGEINGARVLALIGAAVVAGAGLLLVARCRERARLPPAPRRASPLRAAASIARNRPFVMILGAQQLLAFGTGVVGVLGSYVHILFACRGDKDLAGQIAGLGGTLTVLSSLAAIPLGLWISRRHGKRAAALAGLGVLLCGLALLPFTLRPENPWLVVLTWTIDAVGMPCAAMIFGAMMPDICDEDELRTGLRREGAYAAVNSLVGRVTGVATLVASGLLPKLAGYADASAPPSAPVLERMRVMLIAVQIAVVVAAVLIVRLYPITRERAAETRRLVAARRAET